MVAAARALAQDGCCLAQQQKDASLALSHSDWQVRSISPLTIHESKLWQMHCHCACWCEQHDTVRAWTGDSIPIHLHITPAWCLSLFLEVRLLKGLTRWIVASCTETHWSAQPGFISGQRFCHSTAQHVTTTVTGPCQFHNGRHKLSEG